MSAIPTRAGAAEAELLAAARRGDRGAFDRLVERRRSELLAHCYRMLGSLHDAEDAVQETLLRAWRALPRFEGRSATGSWLYRIATNACLDAIGRRPKRVLPIDYGPATAPDAAGGGPLPDATWLDPFPDAMLGPFDGRASPDARYEQREALELAFVAALQHIPAQQRAVLILREVLGFSAREVAEWLGTTVASVNSALQRARRTVDERVPETSQQATVSELGVDAVRAVVDGLVEAFEQGDVAAIVELLADDATFSMPPYRSWYRGRDALADSWLMPDPPPSGLRCVVTSANGQPALAVYGLDEERGVHLPVALDVLTLRDGVITDVVAFRTAGLFAHFGVPEELPA